MRAVIANPLALTISGDEEYAAIEEEPTQDTNNDASYRMTDGATTISDNEQSRRARRMWKAMLAMDEADLRLFDLGSFGRFGLLTTCHQVYHEAVGILYGQNSFTASCIRTTHAWPGGEERETCNQTVFATIWLQSLGSWCKCLKKVSSDYSAM
jgi:hypothetical protein